MEYLNLSSWQQNASNSSVEMAKNYARNMVHIRSLAAFLLSMIGIPGNVLVIAVYAQQMKTSTRVYMFALAVADLTVCVCGVILTSVTLSYLMVQIVVCAGHMTITFSVMLLAFVSIERLLAVTRPHTFSLRARRAKIALIIITLAATFCVTVLTVARLLLYMVFELFVLFITASNVSVMIFCYALMAATLLKNARRNRRRVGVASTAHCQIPGVSTVSTGVVAMSTYIKTTGASCSPRTATMAPASHVKKTDEHHTKSYKGYFLLFIITVVFLASWLPTWLANVGLSVTMDLQRMYILNSIVNPFIYSVVSAMFHDDVRQFYRKTRSNLIRVFT